MYRYKLDVLIDDPTVSEAEPTDRPTTLDFSTSHLASQPQEDDEADWEPLAMSFLLSDHCPEMRTLCEPRSEVERIGYLIEGMPLGEKALLALALLSGQETKSTRLYFECRQLSREDVDYLASKAKTDVFMSWGAETNPKA